MKKGIHWIVIIGALVYIAYHSELFEGIMSSTPKSPANVSARKYLEKMENIQSRITSQTYIVTQSVQSQDSARINKALSELQQNITDAIAEVEEMDDSKGEGSLKLAFIEMLEFYDSLWGMEGQTMASSFLDKSASLNDDIKFFNQRLDSEGADVDRRLDHAQREFLKKFNR